MIKVGDLYISKASLKYAKANWKLIVHLLLRTKFFGVNNDWWFKSPTKSLFGVSNEQIFRDIIGLKQIHLNYKMMKHRAGIGFIPESEYTVLWGELYPTDDDSEDCEEYSEC